jgi:hypothetical protein
MDEAEVKFRWYPAYLEALNGLLASGKYSEDTAPKLAASIADESVERYKKKFHLKDK